MIMRTKHAGINKYWPGVPQACRALSANAFNLGQKSLAGTGNVWVMDGISIKGGSGDVPSVFTAEI